MLDVGVASKGNRFRASRVQALGQMISACVARRGRCEVADIGGTERFWNVWGGEFDWSRIHLTCINLGMEPRTGLGPFGRIDYVGGDARDLSMFGDGAFDLVFSNSVIEHVGLWRDMMRMAAEIRRLAPAYYVQTPYFWFPIEPHARTPFIHWVPESLAYRLVMRRRCGFWGRQSSVSGATRAVQAARLVDIAQLGALFPDATIQRERFYGWTKSLIAIRTGPAGEGG
jgi:hypothetical protein